MAKGRLVTKKKNWSFIKAKVDGGFSLDYEEKNNRYRVFVIQGNTKFFTNLFAPEHRFVVGQASTNAADYTDFNNNYKTVVDTIPPENPQPVSLPEIGLSESSGTKLAIHESSRPQIAGKTFHTVWTGAGDDMSTPALGGGTLLNIETEVGQATTSQDIEFHPNYGQVYVHEGYVQWEDAGWHDYIDVSVHANPTPTQQSVNLDYEIDGSVKIKVADGGPGTGTHGLNGSPVWVPNTSGTGWWDTDGETATFSATQTGAYDWYIVEIEADRFMNKVPVYGSSSQYIMLQSADTSLIPPGYLIRITANNVSNTVWKSWMFVTLYREKTV